MNAILFQYGLKEKQIKSDNNCLFHAIIDQCLQNGIVGWNHISLRNASVKWLFENRETKVNNISLNELFDLNDNRLQQMLYHSIVWGDSSTLFAMAQILNAKIIIYCSSSNIEEIVSLKPYSYTFHIGYYHNIHYVSTIPCVKNIHKICNSNN